MNCFVLVQVQGWQHSFTRNCNGLSQWRVSRVPQPDWREHLPEWKEADGNADSQLHLGQEEGMHLSRRVLANLLQHRKATKVSWWINSQEGTFQGGRNVGRLQLRPQWLWRWHHHQWQQSCDWEEIFWWEWKQSSQEDRQIKWCLNRNFAQQNSYVKCSDPW